MKYYYNMSDGKYTITDSLSLSNYLLKKALVATVPGAGFGADDYIRISFATSMENIKKGVKKPHPKSAKSIVFENRDNKRYAE